MRRENKNIVWMPRHIFMGHDFLIEEINEDKHFVGQSMVSEIFDYMRNSEHVGKKNKQTKTELEMSLSSHT